MTDEAPVEQVQGRRNAPMDDLDDYVDEQDEAFQAYLREAQLRAIAAMDEEDRSVG